MLQKFQNRAARIVIKSGYDEPAASLLNKPKYGTVQDIIKNGGYHCFWNELGHGAKLASPFSTFRHRSK